MSTRDTTKSKPRRKPAKSKGGRTSSSGPAKTGKAKAAASRPAAGRKGAETDKPKPKGGTRRLRPGELDGLVVAHLRDRSDELPVGPGVVAKAIGRSSGAVANCLERLAKADGSPVRRTRDRPRAYDLGGKEATAS